MQFTLPMFRLGHGPREKGRLPSATTIVCLPGVRRHGRPHQERFFSSSTSPPGAPNTVLLLPAPLAPCHPDAVGIILGFRRPQPAHRQAVHYGRWNTRLGLTDAVDATGDMLPVTLLQKKQVSAASGAWRKSRVVEWPAICTEIDCE